MTPGRRAPCARPLLPRLLLLLILPAGLEAHPGIRRAGAGRESEGRGPGARVKRGWVWNQFFVVEEYMGTEPLYVGKIHSDADTGDGAVRYTLSGEGAGTVFLIDEESGDVHATERLDRERKASYALWAQARDGRTGLLLEPETRVTVTVQDVNDSEPRFLHGPYVARVAERSPAGTPVMQVTASDADDPSYGSSARLVYSLPEEEGLFTVDADTGMIRTAAELDRETRDRYELVVRATDMAGQLGGLSGSTTVTVVVTDVDDNPPRFPHKLYQFSVAESAPVGTIVGRVKAEDPDAGANTQVTYWVRPRPGLDHPPAASFSVRTDSDSQEAVILVREPLDFEAEASHTLVLEATSKPAGGRAWAPGPGGERAVVRVTVTDVDEPPEFRAPEGPLEVAEDARVGSLVATVTAHDPDAANSPIRYSIDPASDLERIFAIDAYTGAVVTGKGLDREQAGWYNITVLAMEADNHAQISRAVLRIQILDVNDNPPELTAPFEVAVCEDAQPGQLIQTISVVDRDEPQGGHQFFFRLVSEAGHDADFSLLDVKDNTAGLHTRRTGYSRRPGAVFLLPILVSDGGRPALSSTGTLTVRVCPCDPAGRVHSCNATADRPQARRRTPARLGPGALSALLVALLILTVFALLVLTLKRHREGPRGPDEDEDTRDNVIKYNDEGGGEQDTQAYDMTALRGLFEPGPAGGEPGVAERVPAFLPRGRPPSPEPDFGLFRDLLSRKVALADSDPWVPPYDALRTYDEEGGASPAPTLSPLPSPSSSSDPDPPFAFLDAWGPRFRPLAALYAGLPPPGGCPGGRGPGVIAVRPPSGAGTLCRGRCRGRGQEGSAKPKVSAGLFGSLRVSMDLCGSLRVSVDPWESLRVSMSLWESLWVSESLSGSLCVSVSLCGVSAGPCGSL
ncbi:cadherin-22 [Tachyglossus aculeatus]|uniref:cadherin-22 n=1 Tax=Tachyglossus aculeatus TaxID=9261 RepID=UPI0018F33A5E|nr:cadherin-22 [Tachyglossus aculeatus]